MTTGLDAFGDRQIHGEGVKRVQIYGLSHNSSCSSSKQQNHRLNVNQKGTESGSHQQDILLI